MGGGKSDAKNMSRQQGDIQNKQFGLAQQQLGLSNAALGPSTDFWSSLLKGGQAAVQATGPIASQLGQAASGTTQAIQAMTPRGGEQNLSIAQNYNQLGNNVSRLYSGMQPLAAQGLAQNAGTYLGGAGAFNPQANISAALSSLLGQQQQASQTGAGLGQLAYKGMNSGGKSGASGAAGTAAKTAAAA